MFFFFIILTPVQSLITYACVLVSGPVLGVGPSTGLQGSLVTYKGFLTIVGGGITVPSQRNVDLVYGEHKGELRSYRLLDVVGTCHCKAVWGEEGTLHINSSPHAPPFLLPDLSGSPGFPSQTIYRKANPPPPPDRIPLCCTSSDIVRRAGLHSSDVRGPEHMLQRFPKCYDINGQLCIRLSWDMSRISPDSAVRFFCPVPEHVSRRFCTR